MATLQQLIAEARAEGSFDSEGAFTLDREKAREKMRHFRLADPRAYVVELVQAAVLVAATKIEVELDADDMRMRFDGRAFDREDLDLLYGAMFSRDDAGRLAARRQLALGLNAAMGLDPRYARITSGALQMLLASGKPDQITELETPTAGTEIHVRDRFRGHTLVRFVRQLGGELAEVEHLRQRCRYLHVELSINGKPLARERALPLARAMGRVVFEQPGLRGVAGFESVARDGAVLEVLKHGVLITRAVSGAFPPGFAAVFEADAVRKDISQTAVVRDANWARALSGVKRAVWPALGKLAALARRDAAAAALFRRALLHRSTRVEIQRMASAMLRGDAPDATLATIADVPLWPSALEPAIGAAGHASVSLADVVRAQQRHGAADFSAKAALEPVPWPDGHPVPLVTDPDERDYLARVLGRPPRDVSEELQVAVERAKNVARWRSRAMAPEFPLDRNVIVTVPFEAGDAKGHIGLQVTWSAVSAFWLIKDGCLLERRLGDGLLRGFIAVLAADFTPSRRHDHVVCDALFLRILLDVAHAVPRLLSEVALARHSILISDLREHLLRQLLVPFLALDWEHDGLRAWLAMWQVHDERMLALARDLLRERPAPAPPAPELLVWDTAPAYARVAVFDTIDGGRVSLINLAAELTTHGVLSYVHRKLLASVQPTARVVVVADDREIAALRRVFGAPRMQDFSSEYHAAEGEARHLRQELVAVELESTGVVDHRFGTFEADGDLRGHLCLLSPEPPAVQVHAHLRLLRNGRPFDLIRFASPIGAIVAVVDDDLLQPNADWTGAREDERLAHVRERVVTEAARLLAGLCLPARKGTLPHRALVLNAAARIYSGKHVQAAWAAELVSAIERTPLFYDAGGVAMTLAQIRTARQRDGSVLYTRESRPAAADAQTGPKNRLILQLDIEERLALEAMLGPGALEPAEAWLLARTQAARIRAAPPLTSIALDPKEVLVRTSVSANDVSGEVGLLRGSIEAPSLELRLCHERHLLATATAAAPLALLAILDDRDLPLGDTDLVDLEHLRVGELTALACAQIPALIARLLDEFGPWIGASLRTALTHLVDYLASESGRDDERGVQAQAVYERARRQPVFRGVGGGYSLEQLHAACAAFSEQAYLPVALPGELFEPGRIVLIADAFELPLLRRLFPGMRSYAVDWSRQQLLAPVLRDAPPLPIRPDDALEARAGAIRDGLSADLWLPSDPAAELECAVGAYAKTIAYSRVSALFPCSGRVDGPGLELSADTRSVALTAPQLVSLERLSFRLYEQLAKDLYRPSHGRALHGARAETARNLLQRSARAHAALTDSQTLDADYRAFFDALGNASLGGGAQPLAADATEATREAALLAGLRDALRWAADQHAQLLDALNLDRIVIGVLPQELIAQCRAHGTTINRRHPLVSALLEARERDPVLLAWLASSVYTAMNHFWLEIEDDHEREFVMVLLDELLGALGAA